MRPIALSVLLLLVPPQQDVGDALEAAFATYAAGDHDAALARIRPLVSTSERADVVSDALEGAVRQWPRQIGAAFALEIAAATFEVDVWPAIEILEAGCRRLGRSREDFAHAWHRASIALLLGPSPVNEGRPWPPPRSDVLTRLQDADLPASRWLYSTNSQSHFTHASDRFPDDMGLLFAWALAAEQVVNDYHYRAGVALKHTPTGLLGRGRWFPPRLQPAIRAYTRVLEEADGALHGAAALHLGTMQKYARDHDAALAAWRRVPELTDDPDTRYLARSFAGRVHWERGDAEAAVAAFRDALTIRPGTQSSVVPLAAMLYLLNQRPTASTLAAALIEAPRDAADP